ncbi:hypothetical protein AB5I41_09510 [Sphingomonas sp. MMS24-JH45]
MVQRLLPVRLDAGDASAAARALVSDPNSALYNAVVGGVPYQGGQTLLTARSLTVRYSDYALFQNTGPAGVSLGATIGTASAPGTVMIDAGSTSGNAFALFGTINGIGGIGAALLGPQVILVGTANLTATRVNEPSSVPWRVRRTSTLAQPAVNVFDASRLDLFRSADDLVVPFDPLIGSGNEALFSAITFDAVVTTPACDPKQPRAGCVQQQGDAQ